MDFFPHRKKMEEEMKTIQAVSDVDLDNRVKMMEKKTHIGLEMYRKLTYNNRMVFFLLN